MPNRKEFITRLKPNAGTVRYPENDNFTDPLDGFYIHNQSKYTVYVNWDVDATGGNLDLPIPTGEWRDIGIRVDKFISAYCASDASAKDADVVIAGYRAGKPPAQVITLKREVPPKGKTQDIEHQMHRTPQYLRRGSHVNNQTGG